MLIIEGKETAVQKDAINTDSTEKALSLRVRHSPLHTLQGSSFKGHSVSVEEQDDIVPALHNVYADYRVARAAHNVYAYRIKRPYGAFIEHYEDDGDWGAGAKVLKLLQDNQVENRLVCVTHWSSGSHLGRARFSHILSAAKNSLTMDCP
jgi:putative IMPACT (imprinted ancient) family translation regulator